MVYNIQCLAKVQLTSKHKIGVPKSLTLFSGLLPKRSHLDPMKVSFNGRWTYQFFAGQLNCLFLLFLPQAQCASALEISSTARYLARVYFDLFVLSSPPLKENEYIPFILTALSVSIKFNERQQVVQRYPGPQLLKLANLGCSREFYLSLETQILSALKFKFKFTTPYDYIPIFYSKYPWQANCAQTLEEIIDLTIALPFCANYSAEEIFFGTLATIVTAKNMVLNDVQQKVLLSMTNCWQRAQQLSKLILSQLTEFWPQEKKQ